MLNCSKRNSSFTIWSATTTHLAMFLMHQFTSRVNHAQLVLQELNVMMVFVYKYNSFNH